MNWTSFTDRLPGADIQAPWWEWLSLGGVLHLVFFLLVLMHCLRRRREAPATLLWIFVAWAFPFIGPLVYLAFGIDRVPQKVFSKYRKDQALWKELKARNAETLPLAYWRAVHEAVADIPRGAPGHRFNRAVDSMLSHHPLLDGNRIAPLVNGDETYPEMIKAIRSAGHHIHLQSFIIGSDATGRMFMDLLAEKLRMDPLGLRIQNALRTGDRNGSGVVMTQSTGILSCLETVARHPLWLDREQWKIEAGPHKKRGVGLAAVFNAMGYGRGLPDS
ncbi:MAG TPA: PLDc N-terminal domain-containing protein, partial [Kiritimatiellia bacterium]|nr:PLDc N-terminal domain-containing protein [Kiritimatiellia bacterium]